MGGKEAVDWRAILEGNDPSVRRYRSFFRRIPTSPRCKLCAAPFRGPGAPFMRMMNRGPWEKNPNLCGLCFTKIAENHGGAEIEVTLLFADVRGSTALAEGMPPTEYSRLLNRYYDAATRVLIEHDGIVDKFIGDEVVGLFIRMLSDDDHARDAVAAARALLDATGHGRPDGPWVPIGVGVHTGIAFVGSVGEGGVADFTALGDAVNTTARLASAAATGEILVSRAAATAAGLADAGFEHRHLELRGRTEPVDVVVLRPEAAAVPA